MDKSSTYPHFHISTATICRFVRTYITIFTNKIAQFQHMGEFTPQQLTKSLSKNPYTKVYGFLAPEVRLERTTLRLTAACSAN